MFSNLCSQWVQEAIKSKFWTDERCFIGGIDFGQDTRNGNNLSTFGLGHMWEYSLDVVENSIDVDVNDREVIFKIEIDELWSHVYTSILDHDVQFQTFGFKVSDSLLGDFSRQVKVWDIHFDNCHFVRISTGFFDSFELFEVSGWDDKFFDSSFADFVGKVLSYSRRPTCNPNDLVIEVWFT